MRTAAATANAMTICFMTQSSRESASGFHINGAEPVSHRRARATQGLCGAQMETDNSSAPMHYLLRNQWRSRGLRFLDSPEPSQYGPRGFKVRVGRDRYKPRVSRTWATRAKTATGPSGKPAKPLSPRDSSG